MNYLWTLVVISSVWVGFRTDQLFSGEFSPNSNVKSQQTSERFFLPFPKDVKIISQNQDGNSLVIIFETQNNKSDMVSFYEEILRSKKYDKEFYFENQDSTEFQYSKDDEKIDFVVTDLKNLTNVIIKYEK